MMNCFCKTSNQNLSKNNISRCLCQVKSNAIFQIEKFSKDIKLIEKWLWLTVPFISVFSCWSYHDKYGPISEKADCRGRKSTP